MRKFSLSLLIGMFWPVALLAQTYPEYQSTTVNDFAELLPATQEDMLSDTLATLRSATGVEMTVLTLPRQSAYAPDQSLEQFATGLFNHWGIGDATRNDGVLILVLRDDRAMRIELGKAYGRDWDRAAANVIDDHFLDAFKAGDYPRGLMEGTQAAIDEIVLPFRAGEDAPKEDDDVWFLALAIGIFSLLMGRKRIGDFAMRLRTCPQCGRKGLRQNRFTDVAATTSTTGSGRRLVTCRNCDYAKEEHFTIARRSKSSSGGFGGGSSGGGGASGRW